MCTRNRSSQRGYTLIEMLIVVSIIALLSGAILASVRQGRIKARDAKRKSDLRQIQTALALYYDTYGNYPVTDDGSAPGGKGKGKGKQKNNKKKGTTAWQFSTDSDFWIGCNECFGDEEPDSIKEFLRARVPYDPVNNAPDPRQQGNYSYGYYSLTGEDYDLVAQLEDPGDNQICAQRCWLSHEQSPGRPWCPLNCQNPTLNYSNFIYADH